MNFVYFKDMDSLYLELTPENAEHAWEAHPGVVLNMSADGRVVGIEIEKVSEKSRLDLLKVANFPGQVEVIDRGHSGSTH
jgi:uncharacterized protein YuzE